MHRPRSMSTPLHTIPTREGLFITGTDTGCGKTAVAAGIIHRLRSRGVTAAGMKPVASGCRRTPTGLRNEDAERLLEASGLELDYHQVNPYAFIPPVAPHLAADEAGVTISTDTILAAFRDLRRRADCVVVEGVGGWSVPLGPDFMLADLARALDLPVVLVVGMKLGCLNQALLSARAIRDDGLNLAGWIANAMDPEMERAGANLVSLKGLLAPAPCLGVVDHHAPATAEAVARHLRFDRLMAAMAAEEDEDADQANSSH